MNKCLSSYSFLYYNYYIIKHRANERERNHTSAYPQPRIQNRFQQRIKRKNKFQSIQKSSSWLISMPHERLYHDVSIQNFKGALVAHVREENKYITFNVVRKILFVQLSKLATSNSRSNTRHEV